MVKIATEVQTDEVTSLYKTSEYLTDARRGVEKEKNKFTVDLCIEILKVHLGPGEDDGREVIDTSDKVGKGTVSRRYL